MGENVADVVQGEVVGFESLGAAVNTDLTDVAIIETACDRSSGLVLGGFGLDDGGVE